MTVLKTLLSFVFLSRISCISWLISYFFPLFSFCISWLNNEMEKA